MSEDSIRVGDNLKNREINFQGKDRPDLDMSIRSERLNKSLVFLKNKNENSRLTSPDLKIKYNINDEELAQIQKLDLKSINEIKKILNKAKTTKQGFKS